MATYHLSIVTPEETVFDQEIVSLIVPGVKGYLGVLAHHAPLITPLQPGKITIRLPDESELILAVAGGFLEVANNKATILADAAEPADQIDRDRAAQALERARRRLTDHSAHWDVDRANAALHRALNRIRVAESLATAGQS
ncbi:MAG TPA: F0F1 ATP synthase subunit epsilon [Acidobacteriota bacterium]|nr:F0F1 ATP synthase subunit epsilon [Acidobacteriota bacterium]